MTYFNFKNEILEKADEAEKLIKDSFDEIDRVHKLNSEKILNAFTALNVSSTHLVGTNGYGYDDVGRDKLDEVYAKVFGAEDALVRHSFVNGTHAISTALYGVLRPNDVMLSLTGRPYDTLSELIFGDYGGSLKEFGVLYDEVELMPDGKPNFELIKEKAVNCKVAYIQRSRGYSLRPSLYISDIEKIINIVRSVNEKAIIVVDNCYGEFCEDKEPSDVGADLVIGSLIKNTGGGIAETGGYIVGKKEFVELSAYRLTTVGAGKEVGASLNQNRNMYLGLYNAPNAVSNALKTSVFASALLGLFGYETFPKYNEKRTDIIAALKLGDREKLCAFCKGIQKGSPIDSYLTPEPWGMPGYDSEVIMAAGAFTMGASIELSADAPLREPYAVWIQGGLDYYSSRIGIMTALNEILE